MKQYLNFALRVLTKTDIGDVYIRATEDSIEKALDLIEIVKRRVGGLYQFNKIDSTEIIEESEPELEGLEKTTQKRHVVWFECNLSKDKPHYD